MMPTEPIKSEWGIDQESFLVEIRSLPGYSGSAVFLYSSNPVNDMSVRRFGVEKRLPEPEGNPQEKLKHSIDALKRASASKGPYLLGIDWCHIPNKSRVRRASGEQNDDGSYVLENTGMAGVIPAWKISEVLNCETFTTMRKEGDRKLGNPADADALDSADEGNINSNRG